MSTETHSLTSKVGLQLSTLACSGRFSVPVLVSMGCHYPCSSSWNKPLLSMPASVLPSRTRCTLEFSPIIYQPSIRLFVWFCSTLCREPDTQNTSTPVFPEIYEQAFCLLISSVPSARHDGKYLLSGHPVPSPCLGPK